MIIDFQVLSKVYNEKILNYSGDFHYSCPKCGAKKRFHRHGSYLRWVATLSTENDILFEPLQILRLKCCSCDSTHSILPWDVIPFQIYSLNVVLFLCEQIFLKRKSVRNTMEDTKCTMQMLYHKLNLLKHNLAQIEFYLRQTSVYMSSSCITPSQSLEFLLSPGMHFLSYFQCHGSPIFIERRNTIAYPLSFATAFSE